MKHLKYVVLAFAISLSAITLTLWLYPSSTKFLIYNDSSECVTVTAYWLDEQKELGIIASNNKTEFSVDAEASMKIKAAFVGGRQLKSEGIYFTSNIGDIEARINMNEVRVNYLFEVE